MTDQFRSVLPRPEAIALILKACGHLQLNAQDPDVRHEMARVLTSLPLDARQQDSRLVSALLAEAAAHAEELGYRLEAPGYSCLYIGATSAKLGPTLAILQSHLATDSLARPLQQTPEH